MRSMPRQPLLKRVPPGAWVAMTWCAVTIYPIIRYVALPPHNSVTYSYPRDGLSSPRAQALMAMATVLALASGTQVRRRPLTALALLLAATAGTTLAWRQTEIPLVQFLVPAVALGFITALHPRRTSLIAAALGLATLACYLCLRLPLRGSGDPIEPFEAVLLLIGWLIGNSVHESRAHAEQLRAQATGQAVTGERLRIARELHDMVAHSTGIVALQAGAARRVIDTQPSLAREALGEIEAASREVLAGLRRTLGALRETEPGDPAGGMPAEAPPGLADIDRLAATTAAAGVHIEVRWLGQRRPLPQEISLAAYRIIQEAVTNVVRHADTHSCQVTVDCGADELSIEVIDAGRGHGASTGTGYGLLGMRERVSLLHGEFSAAPRPEGGFRVAARLPAPAAAR